MLHLLFTLLAAVAGEAMKQHPAGFVTADFTVLRASATATKEGNPPKAQAALPSTREASQYLHDLQVIGHTKARVPTQSPALHWVRSHRRHEVKRLGRQPSLPARQRVPALLLHTREEEVKVTGSMGWLFGGGAGSEFCNGASLGLQDLDKRADALGVEGGD